MDMDSTYKLITKLLCLLPLLIPILFIITVLYTCTAGVPPELIDYEFIIGSMMFIGLPLFIGSTFLSIIMIGTYGELIE